jgi:hypothetical protein
MHPVMVIVVSSLLRLAALALAAFRVLGLSLAGASGTSWQFLPAFVLLYFALAPKPSVGAWKYVAVSGLLLIAGSWALIVELHQHPDEAPGLRYAELELLAASVLLHVIYAGWTKGSDWGKWRRV